MDIEPIQTPVISGLLNPPVAAKEPIKAFQGELLMATSLARQFFMMKITMEF